MLTLGICGAGLHGCGGDQNSDQGSDQDGAKRVANMALL